MQMHEMPIVNGSRFNALAHPISQEVSSTLLATAKAENNGSCFLEEIFNVHQDKEKGAISQEGSW